MKATARALKFLDGSPAHVELIEQLRMDGISLFKLATVVLIGTALRKIVRTLAVQLGKLSEGVIAMMKFVARYLFE